MRHAWMGGVVAGCAFILRSVSYWVHATAVALHVAGCTLDTPSHDMPAHPATGGPVDVLLGVALNARLSGVDFRLQA